MDEVRPSVGKIVQPTFLEKYHSFVIKSMVLGSEIRSVEFLKDFGEQKKAKMYWHIILKCIFRKNTDDLTPFYGTKCVSHANGCITL